MGVVSWSQIDEHLHEEKLCDETLHDETFCKTEEVWWSKCFSVWGES